MPITVIENPKGHVAAFNPVIFKLRSSVIPQNEGAGIWNYKEIINDGGFASFVTQGATGINIGDYIEILTGRIWYTSKIHKITDRQKNGAYFNLKTLTPFLGNGTGTLREIYGNPHMICSVRVKTHPAQINFTEVAQVTAKPDENNEFVFDLQEVLKNEITIISLNHPPNSNAIHDIGIDGISKGFSVTLPFNLTFFSKGVNASGLQILEQLLPAGVDTEAAPAGKLGIFYAHNITRQYLERQDLDEYTTNFDNTTSGATNWLTNAFGLKPTEIDGRIGFIVKSPIIKEIGLNEFESIDFIKWEDAQLYRIVQLVDKENELIETFDDPFAGQSYIGRLSVMTGTTHIAITPDTVMYQVSIYDPGDLARFTPIIRYKINRKCKRNKARLHWLNPLGGIDSFTFAGHQKEGIEIKKNTFKKTIGFPNQREIRDFGLEIFNTESLELFTLNTGKISKFTAKWLKELFESPKVYLETQTFEGIELNTKFYIPIHILTDNMIISDTINELQDISFDYRYAFDRVTF